MSRCIGVIKRAIVNIIGCYPNAKGGGSSDVAEHQARTPDQIRADYENLKNELVQLSDKDFEKMFKDIERDYGDFTNLNDRKSTKTQVEIHFYKKQIAEAYSKYQKTKSGYFKYLQDREDYKTAKNICDAGELYLKFLDGEYSFNIVSTIFDEIMNHTVGNSSAEHNEDFVKFDVEQIKSMAQNCTLISIKDESVLRAITAVATMLRQPVDQNDKTKPMAQDINSLGQYGDSIIAATSLFTGYVLITQNSKDFIEDKGIKTRNDKIRQHIQKVSDTHSSYLSDALPHSLRELLNGEIRWPSRQSSLVQMNTSQNPNPMFLDEIEMC